MTPSVEELLREQVRRLTSVERQRLLNAHMEPHPHTEDPAETRIRETGVPVWSVIGHASSVSGDLDQVAEDYEVSREAVVAAVLFYQDHKDLIDIRLRQNQEQSLRLD